MQNKIVDAEMNAADQAREEREDAKDGKEMGGQEWILTGIVLIAGGVVILLVTQLLLKRWIEHFTEKEL